MGCEYKKLQPYLLTTALSSSMRSIYISLLVYRRPAFRHGIVDEKGPEAAEAGLILELKLAPATLRSLLKSEGGNTISFSVLGDVVNGYPPESKVSSRSFQSVNQGTRKRMGSHT